ncbi:MAG: hypothetical protein WB438_07435 [Candidatus Cybelea sp.]
MPHATGVDYRGGGVMTRSTLASNDMIGRYLFGLAAIAFGICVLVFHSFNPWQRFDWLGNIPHQEILLNIVATTQILGGIAIQWQRTARAGAMALGGLYLLFALHWLPLYGQKPLVYGRLGSFFEQFSMVSGALIVYASMDRQPSRAATLARIGYYGFGISVISFALQQLFYLQDTAELVPTWIPPSQMFWAIATTIAFALAAIAILTGRSALLASRLLTLMIVGFGILIWVPASFADPRSMTNWAANAENFGIAGAAWIVAGYLKNKRFT